jgi:hypothetical protein
MANLYKPDTPVNPDPLEARLQAEGFRPGFPPYTQQATKDIDTKIYQRARCQHCRKRCLKCQPYHRGLRYRMVLLCQRCGHREEV